MKVAGPLLVPFVLLLIWAAACSPPAAAQKAQDEPQAEYYLEESLFRRMLDELDREVVQAEQEGHTDRRFLAELRRLIEDFRERYPKETAGEPR